MSEISDIDVAKDIRRVANELGSSRLSRSEYIQHGHFTLYQIYDGGRTWEDLCRLAYITTKRKEPIPDEVYFQHLHKAVQELGRLPKNAERKKYGLNFSKRRYPTLKAFIDKAILVGKLDASIVPVVKSDVQSLRPVRSITKTSKADGLFVNVTRIEQLRTVSSAKFDLTKLIRLCEEANVCYSNGCYLAVAMITRAIIDHVPPILGFDTFTKIANNYRGAKSFKEQMAHLDNSLRRIADSHLHTQIRNKETLPNQTQVNFSNDIDVLLAEIVRVLK